jgi:hypothetical protein
MKANYIGLFFAVFGVLSFGGCDNHAPQPPAKQQPAAPVQAAPKTETPAQPVQPAPPAAKPVEPAASQKAAVGVGAKGRGFGQGVVATPAASLFAARERIVFEIQIPQAMQLFKATEDRGPKDHAEFMERIIKANQIHLPELPEGKQYRYDPKTEQLMVDN